MLRNGRLAVGSVQMVLYIAFPKLVHLLLGVGTACLVKTACLIFGVYNCAMCVLYHTGIRRSLLLELTQHAMSMPKELHETVHQKNQFSPVQLRDLLQLKLLTTWKVYALWFVIYRLDKPHTKAWKQGQTVHLHSSHCFLFTWGMITT